MIDPAEETAVWRTSNVWTKVAIVDGRAEMDLATFDELDDYSCTLPSVVFISKRWKRKEPYSGPGTWHMGEYAEDPDPNMAKILWRRIDIVTVAGKASATTKNIEKMRQALKSVEALT